MRFQLEVEIINSNRIPKDKNRAILSMTKHYLEKCNEKLFRQMYEKGNTESKDLSFSLYMGNCKFLREEIEIPSGSFFVTFTFYDMAVGVEFFNAFSQGKNEVCSYKNYEFRLKKVNIVKEEVFKTNQAFFKALAPIIIREHNHNNAKTRYHSLDEKDGLEIFKANLIRQVGEALDIVNPEVSIQIISNKEVKVKNYDIVLLGNLAKLKVDAEPYILDYLYKSGMGSLKSMGFGMLRVDKG